MSIYSYNQSSVIDEITFKRTANGAVRAYLHARDGIDAQTVQTIQQGLRDADFECVPYTLNDRPVLEVRSFKHEKNLLKTLSEEKWVAGTPDVKLEAGDRISWKDLFRKNTMMLSGITMAVADIGFSIYGMKEAKIHKMVNPSHKRDLSEAMAGLSYLSGSTVLSLYGRNDQSDIQVREMAELILQAARKRGFTTDNSAAVALGAPRKESALTKVNDFFREHPAEIGNMMYFTAGTLIAQSALRNRALVKPRPGMTQQQIHEMRKGGWGDTMLGVSTMASGLLATFGREKAHDPDEPKKHGMAAISDWIQSNPLAVASYGYMGSTLCHAYTTFTERKEALRAAKDMALTKNERFFATEKVKAVPWRVLFIGATLVGELLLSISSKGHGEGVVSDTSVDDSAIAIAAELIVKQPKNAQDHLIEYMGGFLGRQDMLASGHEAAIKSLRQQVDAMRSNPWARTPEMKNEESAITVSPQSETPTWQAKLAAQEAASPQLSA